MSSSPQPSTASEDAEETPTQKKYKGVRLRKWGKWVSEIRLPNSRERVWLGSYDTPEKAAHAFDAAFICLRGPGAEGSINFPNSPPSVRCRSCDPQVVQAAALSHANRVTAHEGAVDSVVLMDVDSSTNATAAWASQGLVVPDVDVDSSTNATAAWASQGLVVPDVDVGNEVVAPVQADGSIDWSPMMANPPPLFSPIGFGSNAYGFLLVPPATVTADAAEDGMEENDNGASTSIWSFLAGNSNF